MSRGLLVVGTWVASGLVFGVFLSEVLTGRSNIARDVQRALMITDHTAIGRHGESQRYTESDPEHRFLSREEKPPSIQVGPARPVFEVRIDRRFLKKLLYKRSVAERRGLLFVDPDSYVPARMSVGLGQYRVWLRLKGDLADHYREDKWSFRIKVRRDQTIFGQRKMSFQGADTRNYLGEWLFHRAFGREGGIAPRYSFVEVRINGTPKGIYALEEHFDKLLIENNNRREGPIVKIDEGSMFEIPRGFFAYNWVNFTAFQLSKLRATESLSRELKVAMSLMEGFRRGVYDAEEVFDLDLLAKYIALADLMGTWHALRYHNLRFYYNGISGLLEPISFDGSTVGNRIEKVAYSSMVNQYQDDFHRRLWQSDEIVSRYLYYLDMFSSKEYLDQLWEEIGEEAERNEEILRLEYPWYEFPRENLYKNQEVMRAFVQAERPS